MVEHLQSEGASDNVTCSVTTAREHRVDIVELWNDNEITRICYKTDGMKLYFTVLEEKASMTARQNVSETLDAGVAIAKRPLKMQITHVSVRASFQHLCFY